MWGEIETQLAESYGDLVGFVITAVQAAAVLAVAILVARFLRGRARRAAGRTALGGNVAILIGNGVSIGVYVVAATLILGLFGASWTALLAVLSVGTVAISLALQDVLKNFVAGIYILLERPFQIGDRVGIRDYEGEVEGIDIRTTLLRSSQGERVLVPNATVFSEVLTNHSFYHLNRLELTLEAVQRPAEEVGGGVRAALTGIAGLREPSPEPRIKRISEEGATYELIVWHDPKDQVESEIVRRLREQFPEATVVVGGA